MNPEPFALLADALRDPETGLNVLSASCPQAPGAPSLPLCSIVTVMEEAWVGRDPLPEEALADGPVCLLRQADEYTVAATPLTDTANPEIAVLIVVAMLKSETHTGLYQVSKLLGTALRSIVKKFDAAGPQGGILINGVEVMTPTQVLYPLLQPEANTSVLAAAAVVLLPVYDPWSLGAHVTP